MLFKKVGDILKYTRYDLKKKNNERKSMSLFLVGVTVLALILGTLIAKIIFPVRNQEAKAENAKIEQTQNNNSADEAKTASAVSSGQNYVMVQCGYYAKKENADQIKDQIKSTVNAVNLMEDDKYRVIAYIGDEQKTQEVVDQLNTLNVNNAKIRFSIPKNDFCNSEISEMVNGYLQILNKFKEKEIKGIKTEEFKAWTNSLKEETESANFEVFKELKEEINNLPDEVVKEDLEKGYQQVFKILNNFKVN